MVCAPLRSIIPSLKLGDYLSHKNKGQQNIHVGSSSQSSNISLRSQLSYLSVKLKKIPASLSYTIILTVYS